MSGVVLAYITGTVTSAVRGGIVNGEYIAMFELQPEGTPEGQRRWIRIRAELTTSGPQRVDQRVRPPMVRALIFSGLPSTR